MQRADKARRIFYPPYALMTTDDRGWTTEKQKSSFVRLSSVVYLPCSVQGTFCCFRRLNLREIPAVAIERRNAGRPKTMSIKRILLPLPGSVDHGAQMDMALSASKALGAHVEALF